MKSNDSPEIPDSGETSDTPRLPSGGLMKNNNNDNKSEEQQQRKLTLSSVVPMPVTLKISVDSVHLGQPVIPLSNTVRDVVFFPLDKNLLTTNQISSVVRPCFFHLRCLGKLCQYPNRKTANAISVSLVLNLRWTTASVVYGAYLRASY